MDGTSVWKDRQSVARTVAEHGQWRPRGRGRCVQVPRTDGTGVHVHQSPEGE